MLVTVEVVVVVVAAKRPNPKPVECSQTGPDQTMKNAFATINGIWMCMSSN
jgi:hypothetical protein